jgi:hypothetical protein
MTQIRFKLGMKLLEGKINRRILKHFLIKRNGTKNFMPFSAEKNALFFC